LSKEQTHKTKDGIPYWRDTDVQEASMPVLARSPLEAIEESLDFFEIPYHGLHRKDDQRWVFRVDEDKGGPCRHVHISVGKGIDAFGHAVDPEALW
jgi:hypothetical protein